MSAVYRGSPLQGEEPYRVAEGSLEARVWALEALLTEKGVVSSDAIDRVVAAYKNDIGPMLGARVVARAWVDPDFRRRLVKDATQACSELDIAGMQGEHMVAVENTQRVHNVACCTLCSCYPWPVLGLPPAWYKNPQYRARIVADPRKTLREDFGLDVPKDVELRVWDSSAEIRYFVLPERPPGTEGLTEQELAALVTRDAMIGVAKVQAPVNG